MGMVKAKSDVYLASEFGGYRKAGETFNYDGPDNEHLEAAEVGPYMSYGIGELKDELTRRGIEIPPDASPLILNNLLGAHDQQHSQNPVVAKEVIPAGKGRGNLQLSAPYTDANIDALKAEAKKRKLDVPKDATDADIRTLLVQDDQKPPVQQVEIVKP